MRFALARMAGFSLEGSSDGDNRTIFSLVRMLIKSASNDTLEECRKPLSVVLSIRIRDTRERFQGCKLTLLHQTIDALFGEADNLIMDKEFANCDRDMILEYLELCRRIFVTKYSPELAEMKRSRQTVEPIYETEIQRAYRLATERASGKGGV